MRAQHTLTRWLNPLVLVLALLVAVGAAACGGDDGDTQPAKKPERAPGITDTPVRAPGAKTTATAPATAPEGDCASDARATQLGAGGTLPETLATAARSWLRTTEDPALAGAVVTGPGSVLAGCAKGMSYAFVATLAAPRRTCAQDLQAWFTKERGDTWRTTTIVCARGVGGVCANTPKSMRSLWYPGKKMSAACGWKSS